MLGTLLCLRATVTRTAEVRPELTIGVFRCRACDQLSMPIRQQFKYTEPKKCKTSNCDSNRWDLENEMCEFADYQKIRVQEDPMVIPPGSMPRSLDVILRNETVERAQPGDICHFFGQLSVVPDIISMIKPGDRTQVLVKNTETRGNTVGMEGVTGLKQTGVRDLNYKLVFICNWVKVENNLFSTESEQKE
jgi:DNA replication licensing factor MCM6